MGSFLVVNYAQRPDDAHEVASAITQRGHDAHVVNLSQPQEEMPLPIHAPFTAVFFVGGFNDFAGGRFKEDLLALLKVPLLHICLVHLSAEYTEASFLQLPRTEQGPRYIAYTDSYEAWRATGHQLDGIQSKLDRLRAQTLPPERAGHRSTIAGLDQHDPRDLLKGYPEPQPKWVGRAAELAELHTAWLAAGTRVYAVVGFGGEGKTALGRRFTETLRGTGEATRRPVVVWWSFYFNRAADEFFTAVLTHFNIPLTEKGSPLSTERRAAKLTDLLRTGIDGRPMLLVLDGFETMQEHTAGREGRVTDTGLRELLRATLDDERPDTPGSGTILITTRAPLRGLRRAGDPRFGELTLDELSVNDGVALLTRQYGLEIDPDDAEAFVKEVGGHALTLTLTGGFLKESGAGAPDLAELRAFIAGIEAEITDPALTTRKARFHRLPGYVLRHCGKALKLEDRQFMRLLSCCVRPATRQDIEDVFLHPLTTQSPTDVASPLVGDEANVASPLVGGDANVASPLVGGDASSLVGGEASSPVVGEDRGRRRPQGATLQDESNSPEPHERKPFNDKLAGGDYGKMRNRVIRHLLQLRLIDGNERTGFDAHPLVRLHFYNEEKGSAPLTDGQRKAVHSRFFDVLTKRPDKHHPDTMEEMQPLIDAVLHGCRAGRADKALRDVFYPRIGRRDAPGRTTFYITSDLGAVETTLVLLRSFFPGGDFSNEPSVSDEGDKAYLVSNAALALLNSGRPATAVPLSKRSLAAYRAQSDWVNASMGCQNLCDSYLRLGRLLEAATAAADALDYIGRVSAGHRFKEAYTQFSHGDAATVAACRGDDEAASEHFTAALELAPDDWLASLHGGWHCTWLARGGVFERARSGAEQNARWCAEKGGLHDQTFALATQALVERLAWAAGDPGRRTLEEMSSYAARAVEVGRRSGHHFYLTYALLEAGRCAVARAEHEPQGRKASVREAEKDLAEAEQRAEYADYRLILADAHMARAALAKLAGDEKTMHEQCQAAIAICDDPTCGYAWAKHDAEALLAH